MKDSFINKENQTDRLCLNNYQLISQFLKSRSNEGENCIFYWDDLNANNINLANYFIEETFEVSSTPT